MRKARKRCAHSIGSSSPARRWKIRCSISGRSSIFSFPVISVPRPIFANAMKRRSAKSPEPRLMERLRHRVQPFFPAPDEGEVLTELPPKLEFPTLCLLSDEQRAVYRTVLEQGRREVFEHSGKAGKGRDHIAVLTTLLRLRRSAVIWTCCPRAMPSAFGRNRRQRWSEPSSWSTRQSTAAIACCSSVNLCACFICCATKR